MLSESWLSLLRVIRLRVSLLVTQIVLLRHIDHLGWVSIHLYFLLLLLLLILLNSTLGFTIILPTHTALEDTVAGTVLWAVSLSNRLLGSCVANRSLHSLIIASFLHRKITFVVICQIELLISSEDIGRFVLSYVMGTKTTEIWTFHREVFAHGAHFHILFGKILHFMDISFGVLSG